jgi:hypothetical protein
MKRLQHNILKLNGFSKPYCQFKWIFQSITTPIKRLILLKANSHAKMAPDTGHRGAEGRGLMRLDASGSEEPEATERRRITVSGLSEGRVA